MFGTLFLKECRQIWKNLTYYILVAGLVFFLWKSDGNHQSVDKAGTGTGGKLWNETQ